MATDQGTGPGMSIRAYAKRRGVSHVAVLNAIKKGRLGAGVQDGRIVDPDLADKEWERRTDLSRAPSAVKERAKASPPASSGSPSSLPAPSGGAPSAHEGMSLTEASATEKIWRAKLAELKYRQDAGELVPAKEVETRLQSLFTRIRTKLLGIPTRAKQAMPHLEPKDLGLFEQLVRETLEELADGATEETGPT